MKFTKFILISGIAISSTDGRACDICSCASSSAYNSILPQFQSNIVGIRQNYSSFLHPTINPNMNGESKVLKDHFYSTDLWLRYRFHKRLFTTVVLPYRTSVRNETVYNSRIQGLGDAKAELTWLPINTGDSTRIARKHTLQLSAGLKMNNGKYMQRMENKVLAPVQLQPGSGSYAAWFRVQHVYRLRRMGIMAGAQTMLTAKNEQEYKQGNQISGNVAAFYWLKWKRAQWLFSAGVSLDHFAKDTKYEIEEMNTGGTLSVAQAGIEWYLGKLSLQFQAQLPVWQNLPASQPKSNMRYAGGIAWFF